MNNNDDNLEEYSNTLTENEFDNDSNVNISSNINDKKEKTIIKDKSFYDKIQSELFIEINKLRHNPKSYIPIIKSQISKLKGRTLVGPDQMKIETEEGQSAYEEAIEFLEEQESVDPLKNEPKLSLAALDLVNDIGPKGLVSHQDSNGGFVSDRIEKYCEWDYCANECIEVSSTNAKEILVSLLVDDGIYERLDRKALFQHIYNYVGFGCGPHKEYKMMTVIVFVGGIRPKGSLFYQYDLKNEEKNDYLSERKKIVNDYQINDPDAPDNTIGLRMVKTQKKVNGKIILITKKFYQLDDGTEHVVELEEY